MPGKCIVQHFKEMGKKITYSKDFKYVRNCAKNNKISVVVPE